VYEVPTAHFAAKADEVASEVSEAADSGEAVSLVETLTAKLAEAEERAQESHERLIRKTADFENAKRRHQKERDEIQRYAAESILKEIVPVLDDVERALEHAPADANETFLEGVQMVHRKFQQVLERRGVTQIDPIGKPFDPQFFEAIQQVEDTTLPHNTVKQAFQKAYVLHERLLRPALVVVAQGGPAYVPPVDVDAASELEGSVEELDEPTSRDDNGVET
jgi:molecular chaperone GrpE